MPSYVVFPQVVHCENGEKTNVFNSLHRCYLHNWPVQAFKTGEDKISLWITEVVAMGPTVLFPAANTCYKASFDCTTKVYKLMKEQTGRASSSSHVRSVTILGKPVYQQQRLVVTVYR